MASHLKKMLARNTTWFLIGTNTVVHGSRAPYVVHGAVVGFMASHLKKMLARNTTWFLIGTNTVVHGSRAPYVVHGAVVGFMINCSGVYYVYLLKSKERNWMYVGSTSDLKRRFSEHNRGEVQSTKPYRPLELLFYEAFIFEGDAVRREDYLKTTKGKSTLRMMLRDSFQITEKINVKFD